MVPVVADVKVARVFAWFNRELQRGFPAAMTRAEIDAVQVWMVGPDGRSGRVKVCRRCKGDQVQLAEHWTDPLNKSGPCPACDGVGKDRFLILCESVVDGTATWFGNDESLMRRVAADRGHGLDDVEIGYQRRHGVRVPPPPVPQPDYGF